MEKSAARFASLHDTDATPWKAGQTLAVEERPTAEHISQGAVATVDVVASSREVDPRRSEHAAYSHATETGHAESDARMSSTLARTTRM